MRKLYDIICLHALLCLGLTVYSGCSVFGGFIVIPSSHVWNGRSYLRSFNALSLFSRLIAVNLAFASLPWKWPHTPFGNLFEGGAFRKRMCRTQGPGQHGDNFPILAFHFYPIPSSRSSCTQKSAIYRQQCAMRAPACTAIWEATSALQFISKWRISKNMITYLTYA